MPRALLNENLIPLNYQQPDMQKRRKVLRDTIEKFSVSGAAEHYENQAQINHQKWKSSQVALPNKVRVIAGDWGNVTLELSKATGVIYAVLNMANAYGPGGGYLEGMVAQEENIFRRTNCHFFVDDSQMDTSKSHYTQEMADLINGAFGTVYLDAVHPRVCIKGNEGIDGSGYDDLPPHDYFLFYELKAAADDLRYGTQFNETSMRKKIIAQLETLKANNIRHVVLSAFGCGAFGNPAVQVARIYKEEIAKRAGDFDDVVFAIYQAGYGPNNFKPFKEALDGLPLIKTPKHSTKTLITTLKTNVDQKVWDERGFVLLFFDFRKTPTGILQIRNILNSTMDEFSKLVALKKVALDRLTNPPVFTKRDHSVHTLYQNILKIDENMIDDDLINQFKAEIAVQPASLNP
jgi:hypothetical protein